MSIANNSDEEFSSYLKEIGVKFTHLVIITL